MLIGSFRREGGELVGRLLTLTLDVPLRLVPSGGRSAGDRADDDADAPRDSRSNKGPDWHVYVDDAGDDGQHGPRVGAGWMRRGRHGAYITFRVDCPTLPGPLFASLWPDRGQEEAHNLYWSRPRQD